MINSGVIFLLMVGPIALPYIDLLISLLHVRSITQTVGSGPDPTVGLCLLYDLTALLFGQPKNDPWYHAFHWIMIVICACLLVELHLSESQHYSWLRGFDVLVIHGTDCPDEDIEQQHPRPRDTALWNESAVPPYLPSIM